MHNPGNWSDLILYSVVVNLKTTVVDKLRQLLPALHGV